MVIGLVLLIILNNNKTMLFNNLALCGVFMLLSLASGQFQPLYIPGHECGGSPLVWNGHHFPPMQSNCSFPNAANSPPIPPTPLHHGLCHCCMAKENMDCDMDCDQTSTTAPHGIWHMLLKKLVAMKVGWKL
jgi:hypothetical protein